MFSAIATTRRRRGEEANACPTGKTERGRPGKSNKKPADAGSLNSPVEAFLHVVPRDRIELPTRGFSVPIKSITY
jgi:hypothetical protein